MIIKALYDWLIHEDYLFQLRFLLAYAILALLICLFIRGRVYRILLSFFEERFTCSDEICQRLRSYSWRLGILLPLIVLFGLSWVRIVQNHGILFGHKLLGGVGGVMALCGVICCWQIGKLVAFYEKCYEKQENSQTRPIHGMIVVIYVALVVISVSVIMAFLTKERPIVFLSSLGAVAAIFAFAFQGILSSMIASMQIAHDSLVKIGDWIVVSDLGIDGRVEMISSRMIKVRNKDMSLASFPLSTLLEKSLVNYADVRKLGKRQIKGTFRLDIRSIRFLSPDEVLELKNQNLVSDEMLSKTEACTETERLKGERLLTNVELFMLYGEQYLASRDDIWEDSFRILRMQQPDPEGLPVEILCYTKKATLVPCANVQRAIYCHLLAMLPAFHLRIYQRDSDFCHLSEEEQNKLNETFPRKIGM